MESVFLGYAIFRDVYHRTLFAGYFLQWKGSKVENVFHPNWNLSATIKREFKNEYIERAEKVSARVTIRRAAGDGARGGFS